MNDLCEYGCGAPAKYILKNNKKCCSSHSTKCPAIRKKNSESKIKSYKNGISSYNYSDLMNWHKNKESNGYKKWVKKCLNETFILNPKSISVDHKKLLIELFNWEYKCAICGIFEWNKTPLKLHLDHINGNNRDYRFENLRFLCPNCHSQTETYCGKNCNTGKLKINDETLIKSLISSKNIYQALLKCGLTAKGENYRRAQKLINEIKESNNFKHIAG